MTADPTGGKQRHGWKPGQSGNLSGRPKGARNAALVALDAIGQEGAEDVLRAVVKAASGGDMRAAELILRRVWPERKGRPLDLALPPIATPTDLPAALSALVAAVAEGSVTPAEAQDLAGLLDVQRRAHETADLERRLAALEAKGSTP